MTEFERQVERLVSYILDDQVRRLDRDVLRSLAERVRVEAITDGQVPEI